MAADTVQACTYNPLRPNASHQVSHDQRAPLEHRDTLRQNGRVRLGRAVGFDPEKIYKKATTPQSPSKQFTLTQMLHISAHEQSLIALGVWHRHFRESLHTL